MAVHSRSPPPPGVSITKTSPAPMSAEAVALSFSRCRRPASTQFTPGCASPPPAIPRGGTRRRLERMLARIGSRKRIWRTTPSPPRCAPAAARAAADREALEQHRKPRLEHLGIGEAGVGHVGLDRARPVEIGAGAGAAGDRLIILVAALPKVKLFIVPWLGASAPSGGEQAVGDRPGWSRHCRRRPRPDSAG